MVESAAGGTVWSYHVGVWVVIGLGILSMMMSFWLSRIMVIRLLRNRILLMLSSLMVMGPSSLVGVGIRRRVSRWVSGGACVGG